MFNEMQVGGIGGGGNAQYETTSQTMNATWNTVTLNCSSDDLQMIAFNDSTNRGVVMYNNGDGTFNKISSSANVNARVNNGNVEFYYNWTGSGVVYNIFYCYTI